MTIISDGVAIVADLMYSRLLSFKVPDFTIQPGLATYEVPDPTTVIFKLTPGVKFHNKQPVNGRVLTARDAMFSLDRLRTPNNPIFINAGDLRSIDKMEATDDRTLRVSLKTPDASLLTTLADSPAIMIAPETLEKFPDLKTADASIGTGPFVIDTFKSDQGGHFTRNENYYKQGLPYFDSAEFFNLQADAAFAQFLSGRLTVSAVSIADYKGFDAKKANVQVGKDLGRGAALEIAPNTKRAPFGDVRARRALSALMDRSQHIAFSYNGDARPSVALGSAHEFWNLSVDETAKLPWGWDPKKRADDIKAGNDLLEAMGYTPDKKWIWTLNLYSDPNQVFGIPSGELIKAMLEKNSGGRISIKLNPMDFGPWRDVAAKGDFDAELAPPTVGWDPDHALSKTQASDGGRNYGRYSSPELDALLVKERSTLDVQSRKAAVQEALKFSADQVPLVWLSAGPRSYPVMQNSVRNFFLGVSAYWGVEGAWFAA